MMMDEEFTFFSFLVKEITSSLELFHITDSSGTESLYVDLVELTESTAQELIFLTNHYIGSDTMIFMGCFQR